jgi:post-segregation antitoxin (ccd killing protein)
MKRTVARHLIRTAIAAGALCAAVLSPALAAQAADEAEARAQESWREAIAQSEVPAEGCFHASYPSMEWKAVECAVAPNIQYRPRSGRISQTVGDGNDYAAEISSGLISKTLGSFPSVTGVTSETGVGGKNSYSLQLNSNFMNTPACDGAAVPADCLDWLQYVYSSDEESAFMQYWLIFWNTTCPAGWFSDGEGDCYKNSAAVTVPKEPITELQTIKISGAAKAGARDTLIMTVGTEAYTTSGKDSVVYLATAWTESEFNVIGDGGGSEAKFNTGSTIKVKIAVTNGTTDEPVCASDAGTTAETNNLTLHACTAKSAATPYIEFTEKN